MPRKRSWGRAAGCRCCQWPRVLASQNTQHVPEGFPTPHAASLTVRCKDRVAPKAGLPHFGVVHIRYRVGAQGLASWLSRLGRAAPKARLAPCLAEPSALAAVASLGATVPLALAFALTKVGAATAACKPQGNIGGRQLFVWHRPGNWHELLPLRGWHLLGPQFAFWPPVRQLQL